MRPTSLSHPLPSEGPERRDKPNRRERTKEVTDPDRSFLSDRDKSDDERATTPESLRSSGSPTCSPPPVPGPSSPGPCRAEGPARRFISSILGGDVPYGSRGHVLTRKEPSLTPRPEAQLTVAKPERLELPRPTTPPRTPRPEAPTRVSVIQRVPPKAQSARREDTKIEIPRNQEPEQVSPWSSITRARGGRPSSVKPLELLDGAAGWSCRSCFIFSLGGQLQPTRVASILTICARAVRQRNLGVAKLGCGKAREWQSLRVAKLARGMAAEGYCRRGHWKLLTYKNYLQKLALPRCSRLRASREVRSPFCFSCRHRLA
jgi:hypothetical protein